MGKAQDGVRQSYQAGDLWRAQITYKGSHKKGRKFCRKFFRYQEDAIKYYNECVKEWNDSKRSKIDEPLDEIPVSLAHDNHRQYVESKRLEDPDDLDFWIIGSWYVEDKEAKIRMGYGKSKRRKLGN